MDRNSRRRKKRRRQKQNFVFVAAIVLIFVIAVIVVVSLSNSSKKKAVVSEGVHYIKSVEALNATDIENNIINTSVKKRLQEMRENLEENPDEVWGMLHDLNLVVMGDSRVVGFDVFGYMDESRVLAEGGAVISEIPNYYDLVEVLNPGILLLGFGLNDVNHTWEWDNVYEYIDAYNGYMEELTARLPNTYIYINSIMPAQDHAILEGSKWGEIPEWNAEIKANCEKMGWHYLDISDLAWEYDYLYDGDGVHMQSDFYPIWARALLMQYLEDVSY